MWLAQSYCDVDLGLFSTEEKAKAALLHYHGSQVEADRWGSIREYTVDVFDDAQCQRIDYRDKAPKSPVAPLPGQMPGTVALLPFSSCYTPAQALQRALQEAPLMDRLIVVGEYLEENGKRALMVLPSRMTLLEAVWLDRRLDNYINENA